jgi:hypothetical protein
MSTELQRVPRLTQYRYTHHVCVRVVGGVWVLNYVPEGKIEAEFDQNVNSFSFEVNAIPCRLASGNKSVLLISRIESGR